jgi:hypothetical protein
MLPVSAFDSDRFFDFCCRYVRRRGNCPPVCGRRQPTPRKLTGPQYKTHLYGPSEDRRLRYCRI